MKIKLYAFVYIAGLVAIASSCNKKNDYSNNNVAVIKEWIFPLSSFNENYVMPQKETTAKFHMALSSDSTMSYDVKIDSTTDNIVTVQIYSGDPLTNGQLLLNLPVRIYGSYASGVSTGLRQGLMDTLLNSNIDTYINVNTQNTPLGLVRGQLNSTIVVSGNVQLTGAAVVPSLATTATGTAYLRLTSDNTLYSKVMVNNDPADVAKGATVNQGITGANGPAILTLASSSSDFGLAKKTIVNASVYSALLNNNTYVNVTSAQNPGGKVRGQIK